MTARNTRDLNKKCAKTIQVSKWSNIAQSVAKAIANNALWKKMALQFAGYVLVSS